MIPPPCPHQHSCVGREALVTTCSHCNESEEKELPFHKLFFNGAFVEESISCHWGGEARGKAYCRLCENSRNVTRHVVLKQLPDTLVL